MHFDPNYYSYRRRQNIKTIIVAVTIFVTTIGATILVGWITSIQSTSQYDALPPQIDFEKREDILIATSFDDVESWHYVGPIDQSDCDNSLFDEVLLGKRYKEGNQIRIDYARDYQKYYCFRATSQDNRPGFAIYYLDKLIPPAILFKISQTEIEAYLNPDEDSTTYSNNWQHVTLKDSITACDQLAFSHNQTAVVNGNKANTDNFQEDKYLCFRLSTLSGDHVYQAKLVQINSSIEPVINAHLLGSNLYLTSDQLNISWQAVNLDASQNCQLNSFNNQNTYIKKPVAIINTQQANNTNTNFCIRVINPKGVDNYYIYLADQNKPSIDIVIETSRSLDGQTIAMEAKVNQDTVGWQVKHVKDIQTCVDNFQDQPTLANTAAISTDYFRSQLTIFCWQGSNPSYQISKAVFIIPASTNRLVSYQLDSTITSRDLWAEPLNNWQFIKTDQQPLTTTCHATDFEAYTTYSGQTATGEEATYYCFRAQLNQNTYYSQWIKANLGSTKSDEYKIALGYDLKLTKLGQALLNQAELKIHDNQNQIRLACSSSIIDSCYNKRQNMIHLYKYANYDHSSTDLKLALLQYLRQNLLNSNQREIQNFQLQSDYLLQTDLINNLDVNNHLSQTIFQSEFDDITYSLVMKAIIDNPNNQQLNDWRNYYQLFFT